MSKKNTVTFLLYYESIRLNLYFSISTWYHEQGWEVNFVVQDYKTKNKLSSKLIEAKLVVNVLVFKIKSNVSCVYNDIDFSRTLDVLTGNYDSKTVKSLFESYKEFLEISLASSAIVYAGNGLHTQDLALKNATLNAKYVFNDLANIDDRVFLDPSGTNCNSKYYETESNASVLTDHELEELNNWRINYKNKKLNSHVVKQVALNFAQPTVLERVKNILYTYFEFVNNIGSYNVVKFGLYHEYLKSRLSRNKENIVKEKNLPKFTDLDNLGGYIFVPLQVTNDSQILLNSNYDNLQVINYFKVKAKKLSLNLVLKLHPAEPNHEFKNQIYSMVEQSENIFLSNDNTFSLLDNADFIGVNNSTVGLEAIILGKNTQFLGKTFYDKLKEDKELYHYLNQYLLKADFFSGEIFETDLLNKIHTLIGFKG